MHLAMRQKKQSLKIKNVHTQKNIPSHANPFFIFPKSLSFCLHPRTFICIFHCSHTVFLTGVRDSHTKGKGRMMSRESGNETGFQGNKFFIHRLLMWVFYAQLLSNAPLGQKQKRKRRRQKKINLNNLPYEEKRVSLVYDRLIIFCLYFLNDSYANRFFFCLFTLMLLRFLFIRMMGTTTLKTVKETIERFFFIQEQFQSCDMIVNS